MEIAEEGVLVCKDYNGRPSGEAFVELQSEDDIEKAVEKHNESMGHRWGYIFIRVKYLKIFLLFYQSKTKRFSLGWVVTPGGQYTGGFPLNQSESNCQ